MYVKGWSLNHEKSINDFQFISLNLLMMKIRWNENGISQITQDANKKSIPIKYISDV
jgi:hypothetical protein